MAIARCERTTMVFALVEVVALFLVPVPAGLLSVLADTSSVVTFFVFSTLIVTFA